MRKIRRLWALVLTIILVVTQLSAVTFAAENDITVAAADYLEEPVGAFAKYGSIVDIGPNILVEYEVNATVAGTYTLSLLAGTQPGGVTVHVFVGGVEKRSAQIDTGDWGTRQECTIGNIQLAPGVNTVGIKTSGAASQTMGFTTLTFTYQEPTDPAEFEGFSAGDTAIAEGDEIARGTDCITASFTESINSANAALTDADGTEIATETTVTDNKVTITLKETLDYSAEYQLSLTNVTDLNGNTCTVPALNFTTSDAAGDSGSASIEITDCIIDGLTLTLNAKMFGSKGQAIKGRNADITVKNPSANVIAKESVTSGDDGLISYIYVLAENSPEGTYTITADGEYVTTAAETTQTFDADFEVKDIVRNAAPFDNSLPPGGWTVYGTTLGFGSGPEPEYNMIVPKSGKYMIKINTGTLSGGVTVNVKVNGVESLSKKVETNGWASPADFDMGIVSLPAGNVTIGISVSGSNTMQLRTITLSYVKPGEFTAYSAGGNTVTDGAVVPRGTDSITASFTETISSAKAVLTDESGTEVAAEVAVADKIVTVNLKETLDYSAAYKLSLTEVTDINGNSCKAPELGFTTSAQAADSGSGAVTADSCEIDDLTFTLKGTMLSSTNTPIKGRKANITIKDPDSQVVKEDSCISGEDGAITYTYTLPAGSPAGIYTFVIGGEYVAQTAEITQRYISEELKTEILGEFEDSQTTDDIEAIFTTYSRELNVDVAEINALDDADSFYSRFIGESFDGMEDFDKTYTANYALELIDMAATTADIEAVILDAEYAAALDIDSGKYTVLSEQKATLAGDILALNRQDNAEAFTTNYDTLANKAMATEAGKADVTLTVASKSVKVGQTAETEIGCSVEITDASAYTIEVVCESTDAAKRLSLDVSNGKVKTTTNGTVAVFEVTDLDTTKTLKTLGTLCYDTEDTETADFEVKGAVVYNVDGIPYDITCGINDTDTSITVSQASSPPKGGGTTTTPAGISSPKPQTTPNETDETKTDENTDIPFDDIADVEWATASIIELYNKGVISDSEDRLFRPNDDVSRAEFVKLIVAALGINDKTAEVTFSDVSKDAWYYSYVANAVNYGLIKGDENNNFNPEVGITREDVCVIFSRVMEKLGYPEETNLDTEAFVDDAQISDYARNAVYLMRSYEIVNGVGGGMFEPKGNTTRAMAAKMIVYFLEAMKI